VSLVDLPAMMLAEVENFESQISDFKFQIKNSFARISMPSVVRLPQQCDHAWRGVRTKIRKLVLTADGSPWLFFDLESDPHELHNLAQDPARAREIAELRALIG
jgi:hypothetical protein